MLSKIKYKLLSYKWDLAYGEYRDSIIDTGLDSKGIHYIKNPYKQKWFADPFILDYDEKYITLLVEEFDDFVKRGRIAKIRIDRSLDIIDRCDIILELSTHLSFPAIYRIKDEIYVHPENSASGQSKIYRYDCEKNLLVDPVVILEEPVTDAIIISEGDGCYKMFATTLPTPNGKELCVYESNSFFGPYKLLDSLHYNKSIARMAGAMLKTPTGEIVRPAQDCDGGDYGKAVLLMSDKDTRVVITPPTKKYAGLHTFNHFRGLYIVDLKIYDYPWLYRLKTHLKG